MHLTILAETVKARSAGVAALTSGLAQGSGAPMTPVGRKGVDVGFDIIGWGLGVPVATLVLRVGSREGRVVIALALELRLRLGVRMGGGLRLRLESVAGELVGHMVGGCDCLRRHVHGVPVVSVESVVRSNWPAGVMVVHGMLDDHARLFGKQ